MILLTGGTGFLGSQALKALLSCYAPGEIYVLLNKTHPADIEKTKVNLIDGGLLSIAGKYEELKMITCIIHLASKTTDADKTGFLIDNVTGTANLIELAKKIEVKKVIFVNSTGVYGPGDYYGSPETTPKKPDTLYSKSKWDAETIVQNSGLPFIILRHRFVIGDGDKFVIPAFISAMKKLPFLINSGKAVLSFIDVTDLAAIIVNLSMRDFTSNLCGEYHVTNGENINIANVFDTISSTLGISAGKKISVPFAPLYLLIRAKEMFSGKNSATTGFNSVRLNFFSRNNHFSNKKIQAVFPEMKYLTFEESLIKSKMYYTNLCNNILLRN